MNRIPRRWYFPFAVLLTWSISVAAAQPTWEEEMKLNGPTGKVVTDEGEFRLLRIGVPHAPHPLYLGGRRPVEIKTVEFLDPCCDILLTLRSGETVKFNAGQLYHRTEEAVYTSYGIYDGLPVVIVDAHGRVSTRTYPNLNGLIRFEFDAPEEWVNKPADTITFGVLADPALAAAAAAQRSSPAAPTVAPDRSDAKGDAIGIGAKVCTYVEGTMEEATGLVIGGKPATRTISGRAAITAFVERVEGPRWQMRVGGVLFLPASGKSQPLDVFRYEGSQLSPNMLFWDEASRWSEGGCGF